MRIDDAIMKFQTVYLEKGLEMPPAAEEPEAGSESTEETEEAGKETA